MIILLYEIFVANTLNIKMMTGSIDMKKFAMKVLLFSNFTSFKNYLKSDIMKKVPRSAH